MPEAGIIDWGRFALKLPISSQSREALARLAASRQRPQRRKGAGLELREGWPVYPRNTPALREKKGKLKKFLTEDNEGPAGGPPPPPTAPRYAPPVVRKRLRPRARG
jgi:hypothetical protein